MTGLAVRRGIPYAIPGRICRTLAILMCTAGVLALTGCRRRESMPADPVERLALARNLVRQGRIDRALEMYKALLDSNAPNRSRIALEAALVCRQRKMTDGVLFFTDYVDEEAPERRTADELVVDALLTKGDRGRLEHFLRRKWKNPATRVWAAPFLAELLMQNGEQDEALDIYAALIREHPEREEEWRLARARLCLKAGNTARARAEFDAILRKNPKSVSALLGLATLAVGDHDWDEAKRLFEKALALAPENTDAALGLAFVLLSQGRVKEAEQRYEQVLNMPRPPYLKLLPYLDLLYDLRKWDRLEALAVLGAPPEEKTAARPGPDSGAPPGSSGATPRKTAPEPPASSSAAGTGSEQSGNGRIVFGLYAAALLDIAHGKRDAAQKSLERLLAIEPEPPDVQVFIRYADLLLRAGRVTDAKKTLEQARRIGPLPDAGLLLMAEIALEEGRISTAMRLARVVGQNNPRASLILARCEAAMGKVSEALRVLKQREQKVTHTRSRTDVVETARLMLEADQLEKSGDYRKAEKLLERVASTAADRPAALLARAKRAWAEGRKQEAARILDRLVQVLPDGRAKIAALRLRLRTALASGDARRARTVLDELKEKQVPHLELYEGWLAAVEGKWTEAVDLLKKSRVDYGWDGMVRFLLLGLAAARTGDMKAAATAFDAALQAVASPPASLYALARDAAILAGDIDTAVARAESVANLRRNDPEAVIVLSRLYDATYQQAKRVRLLEDAIRRFPDRADVRLEYCRALLAAGDVRQAETAARNAMKRFPRETGFRICLMQALLLQKRSNELRRLAESMPQDSPEGLTARIIAALDRIYARDPQSAARIVAGLPADDPRVRLVKAWVDLEEGRRDRARKELEALTAAHPDMFQAYLLLGNLYSAEGKYDRAADALRRCLDLAPDSVVALNNLAWVLLQAKTSLNEAYSCAAKARRLAPDSPEVNDTFAAAALVAGNWKEALEAALKAARANPGKFWPWMHAAQAASKLGRPQEAEVYLEKARANARTERQRRALAALQPVLQAPPAGKQGGG